MSPGALAAVEEDGRARRRDADAVHVELHAQELQEVQEQVPEPRLAVERLAARGRVLPQERNDQAPRATKC